MHPSVPPDAAEETEYELVKQSVSVGSWDPGIIWSVMNRSVRSSVVSSFPSGV